MKKMKFVILRVCRKGSGGIEVKRRCVAAASIFQE